MKIIKTIFFSILFCVGATLVVVFFPQISAPIKSATENVMDAIKDGVARLANQDNPAQIEDINSPNGKTQFSASLSEIGKADGSGVSDDLGEKIESFRITLLSYVNTFTEELAKKFSSSGGTISGNVIIKGGSLTVADIRGLENNLDLNSYRITNLKNPSSDSDAATKKYVDDEIDSLDFSSGGIAAETDPLFSLSSASGISSTNISNWNSAYGWGDHSTQGYLTVAAAESDPLAMAYLNQSVKTDANPTFTGLTLNGDLSRGTNAILGTGNLGATDGYIGISYITRNYFNSTAYLDGATAGTINATGNLNISGNMASDSSVSAIRYAIANRHYDAIVRVTTTITAALAAITDNNVTKRYLLYVPNGTYNEENVQMKSFVDVVGESVDGVIVQSSSGDYDTIMAGGVNAMLSNMTINHTSNIGDAGVTKYPIHGDFTTDTNSSVTTPASSTTIFYKLKVNALGTNSKHGMGLGFRTAQRVYIVDCEVYSQVAGGIGGHNMPYPEINSYTKPMELYIVNTIARGKTNGFFFDSTGSGSASDRVAIFGGTISGETADDIRMGNFNTGQYHGEGETYLFLDPYVKYSTRSLVDSSKLLTTSQIVSLPQQNDLVHAEYAGQQLTSLSTLPIIIKGLSTLSPAASGSTATGTLALEGSSGNTLYMGSYTNSPYGSWIQSSVKNSLGQNYSISLNPNGGNIGIGMTAPESTLHIQKSSAGDVGPILFIDNAATSTNGNAGDIRFGIYTGQTVNTYGARIRATESNSGTGKTDLTFGASSIAGVVNEMLKITGSGVGVGIGATDPFGAFQIGVQTGTFTTWNSNIANIYGAYDSVRPTLSLATTNSPTINVGGSLGLGGTSYDTSVGYTIPFGLIKGAKEISGNDFKGYLSFGTSRTADAVMVEHMRISSAGGVGINTTTPYGTSLQVGTATGAYTGSNSSFANIFGAYSASRPTLGLFTTDSATVGYGASLSLGGVSDGGSVPFGTIKGLKESATAYRGYLSFHTTDNTLVSPEWMRITSFGNVGIGTTLPEAKLQISGGGLCVGDDIVCTTSTNSIGYVYATNYTTFASDYAEHFYSKDTDLKSGEVVCVDTQSDNAVKRCQNDGDNNVMGVVSTQPAVLGNSIKKAKDNPKNYPIIAMLGQIPGYVEVTSENAEPIQIGDALAASSVSGYMRKAKAGESTVGVALEKYPNKSGEDDMIQILISRKNKSLTVENVEEETEKRIAELNIQDQVNSLISQANQDLEDSLNERVLNLEQNQTELSTVIEAQIEELKKLNLLTAKIDTNTTELDLIKTILGIDRTENPEDLDIMGKLSAETLETGKLVISINDEDDATIGEGIIEAGETEVEIETTAVREGSKVFVTLSSEVSDEVTIMAPSGEIEDKESFIVKILKAVEDDLKFNWWIVEMVK